MLAKTYKIVTDRLVIRCYQPEDASLLKTTIDESLDHLLPWMVWAKHEPEPVEIKMDRLRKYRGQFDLGVDYTFGIFDKEEQNLIGSTGLHNRRGETAREIGYWIGAKYIKQGFATENVRALVKIGFEIEQLERIEIRCAPDNIASRSVPKKLGFIHEATLRDRVTAPDGNPSDIMIWSLFKDDYLKSDLVNFNLKAFGADGKAIIMDNLA
jgi:RimJ/RimL family protein N-acetyltransferase